MKYISLAAFSFAVLLSGGMQARQISETEALAYAAEFRGLKGNGLKHSAIDKNMKLAYKAPADFGTAFYIFNSGSDGGFTIVSGNDAMPRILGYSDNGYFDPERMPENVRNWLEGYASQAEYAVENGFVAVSVKKDSRKDIPALMTTVWDQETPFNTLCPTIRGQKCPTGCVATAMAQIMKFHEWPQAAKGTCVYDGKTVTLNSIYEWDRMLDSYKGSYTNAAANAVSQLMWDCGRSVDMEYSPMGSGALSNDIQPAMINNFSYDPSVSYSLRRFYSDEDWENLIYSEIAAGRPVLYGGESEEVGHQFVADGYRAGGYFHINWGWSGSCDGYFLLDALDPEELGTGGGTSGSGFNYEQDAVYSIMKPTDGGRQQIQVCGTGNFAAAGTNKDDTDIFSISDTYLVSESGQRIKGFINFTGMEFTVDFGVRLINVADNKETDVKYGELTKMIPWSTVVNDLPLEMPSLGNGRYLVYPYCFAEDAGRTYGSLIRVPATKNGYLVLDVENGRRTYYAPEDAPTILASSISVYPTSFELEPGESVTLGAQILPAIASQQKLIWSSSDSSVASVDDSGYVKANKVGSADITVSTTDGSGLKTSSKITVTKPSGINEVYNQGNITVYSADGVLLFKDVNASILDDLDEGLYIVNGKKVMIKK